MPGKVDSYPRWNYYPQNVRPPEWVRDLASVFSGVQATIDSRVVAGLTSNSVLAQIRPGLLALGYEVEGGKTADSKNRRPVLFGDEGAERVSYEIGAFHPFLGVAVEIEAGRGSMGNAVYRDLVRTSLLVDAQYLVLGQMLEYRYNKNDRVSPDAAYRKAKDLLDAIFASGRLKLPFEGVVLIGY